MFVLSTIAVFSCSKIVESLFSSKDGRVLWGGEAPDTQLKTSFQASSQARFLRAHALTRGSYVWGF